MRVDEGTVARLESQSAPSGPDPCAPTRPRSALADTSTGDAVALAEAAALAADASEAVEDANGSAEYKLQLVRVLVERCFRDAAGVT